MQAHILTHVRFTEGADVEFQDLFVTADSMVLDNLTLQHEGVHTQSLALALAVCGAWIVGEVDVCKARIPHYSTDISLLWHVCRKPLSTLSVEAASKNLSFPYLVWRIT